MNAIVCVDKNWGIGKNGGLLFDIHEDMVNFYINTLYKPIIMGLNTFNSLPDKMPLKNRLNIVIASEDASLPETVVHLTSIKELSDYLTMYNLIEDAMVIGGGTIYNLLLPYCKYAFVTQVDMDGNADTFIRDLDDLNEGFKLIYKTPNLNSDRTSFRYTIYENKKLKL